MFDGDYDDFFQIRQVGVTILTIAVIIGLSFGIYRTAKNLMNEGLEQFSQSVTELEQLELEQTDTVTNNTVGTEDSTIVENIQIEADKVINANTYVDNSQNIINEAQHNSYVLPITLGLIFAFIIIIFEKWLKHKKEKDERTERILNTPLQTYEQTEVDALKDKYKGTE